MAEVSAPAIYQYESGRSSPGADVLVRLAGALGMPEHFFVLPARSYERGTTFWRSMHSTTKAARVRAERRMTWLRDIVYFLADAAELPPSNFPHLNLPDDPHLMTPADVENAADLVRRHWNMTDGPIANMTALLENQGACVAMDALGSVKLDGLSEFAPGDGRPYILVGTDKGSCVRFRFDNAHELGHMILHAHVSDDALRRVADFKLIEDQAHHFARAFLLPAGSFGDDLFAANLDCFESLKPKWKTAVSTMIIRCRDLGFLSDDAERRLWINLSRRGWRTAEPFDDSLEPESPRSLRVAFEYLLSQPGAMPDDVVAALGIPASDVEQLAALPSGYIGSYSRVTRFPQPLQLDFGAQADAEPGGSRDAEIIPLPLRPRS